MNAHTRKRESIRKKLQKSQKLKIYLQTFQQKIEEKASVTHILVERFK